MSSLFRRFGRLLRSNIIPTEDSPSSSEKSGDWQPYSERSAEPPRNPPKEDPETRFYRALELPAGASFDQIRQAYKSQMKKYHPDRFPNDPEKRKYAQQVSQQLNEAYAYFEKKYGR
jgi:DnaJ-domain-containing protein 1